VTDACASPKILEMEYTAKLHDNVTPDSSTEEPGTLCQWLFDYDFCAL
jgi:hypothetical protein